MTHPHYIDADLLAKAQDGHRPAIRTLAGIAADSLGPMTPTDDALAWAAVALQRIEAGEEPNQAFGWNRRGRPRTQHEFERWTWAKWVKTLRAEDSSLSVEQAMILVGKAARKSGPNGGTIQQAWTAYQDADMPLDLFPIPEEVMARIRQFEERIEALRRPKQKP
jgi:hypothetical protein